METIALFLIENFNLSIFKHFMLLFKRLSIAFCNDLSHYFLDDTGHPKQQWAVLLLIINLSKL